MSKVFSSNGEPCPGSISLQPLVCITINVYQWLESGYSDTDVKAGLYKTQLSLMVITAALTNPYRQFALFCIGAILSAVNMWYVTQESLQVDWGIPQGKFQLWANCLTSRSPVSNTGLRILETPSAIHYCVQRLNHLAMTRLSKRIGTSWKVSHIEHNSALILSKNDFTLDCLHVALA